MVLLCAIFLASFTLSLLSGSEKKHLGQAIDHIDVTKILFKSNHISERGTEVAIFDYGYFAEKFFHVESSFVFKRLISTSAFEKFQSTFPERVYLPSSMATDEERSQFVRDVAAQVKPDAFYSIEAGDTMSEMVENTTTLVHAVFSCDFKHGDKYVAISDFVYDIGGECEGVVPHMVWLPDDPVDSLRKSLGIPENVLVFGWYGGHDAWDDKATSVILEVAQKRREDVYFLFRNFKDDSLLQLSTNPNILSLPLDSNLLSKKRFILTCDAFLHTRTLGETFGLAVAEFSILERPIITNCCSPHRFHLDILQDDCYTYSSMIELTELLLSLTKANIMKRNFSAHYENFSPSRVMDTFNRVFFGGRLMLK